MIGLGLCVSMASNGRVLQFTGGEIATTALWPSTGGVVSSDAALSEFGPVATGVSISTDASSSQNWQRAFHSPPIPLVPGTTYECVVWYVAGSSGRIRLNAYGDGGATELRVNGPAASPAVTASPNFIVTDFTVEAFGSGYKISFIAEMSADASSEISLGIGPDANAPLQDVILLAARLVAV